MVKKKALEVPLVNLSALTVLRIFTISFAIVESHSDVGLESYWTQDIGNNKSSTPFLI